MPSVVMTTRRSTLLALMALLIGSTCLIMLHFISHDSFYMTQSQQHQNAIIDLPTHTVNHTEVREQELEQLRQDLSRQHAEQVERLEQEHSKALSNVQQELTNVTQTHQLAQESSTKVYEQHIQQMELRHEEELSQLRAELELWKTKTAERETTSPQNNSSSTSSSIQIHQSSQPGSISLDNVTISDVNLTIQGEELEFSDGNTAATNAPTRYKNRPKNFAVVNGGISNQSIPLPTVPKPNIMRRGSDELLDLSTQELREAAGYTSPSCTLQLDDDAPINRIVFLHMRKAGGSSMRNYFRRVAKANQLAFLAEEGYKEGEFPGNSSNTLYITHWREPIARAVSHYKYELRWDCSRQLKKKDFVPIYNNTQMSLRDFAKREWYKRNKFWKCSQECHSRWATFTHDQKILQQKEYLEQFARQVFGGYHLIIITEWLRMPGYAASLENLFNKTGINQFAGMMCRERTVKANEANPLIISEDDMKVLQERNVVDTKLYNEYTSCPEKGPQFWNRKINFVKHEAGFGYNSMAAAAGTHGNLTQAQEDAEQEGGGSSGGDEEGAPLMQDEVEE